MIGLSAKMVLLVVLVLGQGIILVILMDVMGVKSVFSRLNMLKSLQFYVDSSGQELDIGVMSLLNEFHIIDN